jgi:hypothetical protein
LVFSVEGLSRHMAGANPERAASTLDLDRLCGVSDIPDPYAVCAPPAAPAALASAKCAASGGRRGR